MFQQKLSSLKRFVFAAMAFLALSAAAFAQNVTVTGRVRRISVPERTPVMKDRAVSRWMILLPSFAEHVHIG